MGTFLNNLVANFPLIFGAISVVLCSIGIYLNHFRKLNTFQQMKKILRCKQMDFKHLNIMFSL